MFICSGSSSLSSKNSIVKSNENNGTGASSLTARKYTINRAMKKTTPAVINKPNEDSKKANYSQDEDNDQAYSVSNCKTNNSNRTSADKKKRTREEAGPMVMKHHLPDKENIGLGIKSYSTAAGTASTVMPSSSSLQKKSKPNGLEEIVNNRVVAVPTALAIPIPTKLTPTTNLVKKASSNKTPCLSVSILHTSINSNEINEVCFIDKIFVKI